MISPEQFSRKMTADLETAMSLAVTRTISGQFLGPGGAGQIGFVELHEDWPSYEQAYVMPTATILPDAPLVYGPSHLVPRLLEDTWEPVGEPGLGLYELSEASRDLTLQYRAGTAAERNALKAGIETAFVAPEVTLAPVAGARYGILQAMPEYWGLMVRLAITDSQKLDDAESAVQNRWEGRATISCQAKLVKLAIVQPFRLRIKEIIGTDPVP